MIKVIIGFDFDGTLYHSNEIKKQAFYLTVSKYENSRIIISEILNKNPILNRNAIFDLFTKAYKKNFPNSINIDAKLLSNNYTKLCFTQITKYAKPRKGMHEILDYLFEKNISCYLISATPVEELKKIINNLDLNKFFKSIYGAPESKESLINTIIKNEKISKNNFFYIGDKFSDYDAARVVGCNFIPISDDKEFGKMFRKTFNNLSDLIKIIEEKI